MARKKTEKSEISPEQQALVQRVDAMMNLDTTVPAPEPAAPPTDQAGQKTAPELTGDLLKRLKTRPKTDAAATKPLPKPTLPVPEFTPEAEPKPEPEPKQESQPEPAPEPTAEPGKAAIAAVDLEDSETDKAVDDIVANEGDTLLALEDLKAQRRQKVTPPKRPGRLRRLLADKRAIWLLPLVLLLIVFGLPLTRYKLLGLVLKKTASITVVDAKTDTPVSNAEVSLGGTAIKTDAQGVAQVRAGVGLHIVTISKQYYRTTNASYFVGLTAGSPPKFTLTATGRLVPITVLNRVSGLPVPGATVHILNTTARTNVKGLATIALPVGKTAQAATISLAGYNQLSATVQVTDTVVNANSFQLTPAGHVYFLTRGNGGLDVVKTNLDGSGRTVVLEASGLEDPKTTSLLPSRDWRYLVLKSHREGSQAALYLIDTSNDKVTEFDNSNSSFNLIGWYSHFFMYQLTSNSKSAWQPGAVAIKSYDADHQQLNQLDQDQAEGSSGNYAAQNFLNFYIFNNELVYTTLWQGVASKLSSYDLSGKNDTIRGIQPNGQNKKDYQQFPANTTGTMQATQYQPQGAYFSIFDITADKTQYYQYQNQAVTTASIDDTAFNKGYPTYLLSATGNKSFWTELINGKNSLFTGDANGQNKTQVASASDYQPYGWYGDTYLLVSQNNNQLYIMPSNSLPAGHTPLKITDY